MFIVESYDIRETAPKDFPAWAIMDYWRQWFIRFPTLDKAIAAVTAQVTNIANWGDLPKRRYRVSEVEDDRKTVVWVLEPRH